MRAAGKCPPTPSDRGGTGLAVLALTHKRGCILTARPWPLTRGHPHQHCLHSTIAPSYRSSHPTHKCTHTHTPTHAETRKAKDASGIKDSFILFSRYQVKLVNMKSGGWGCLQTHFSNIHLPGMRRMRAQKKKLLNFFLSITAAPALPVRDSIVACRSTPATLVPGFLVINGPQTIGITQLCYSIHFRTSDNGQAATI